MTYTQEQIQLLDLAALQAITVADIAEFTLDQRAAFTGVQIDWFTEEQALAWQFNH